jgi:hypothetical protein
MSWGGLNCAALGRTRLSRWLGRVTTENNNVMVRDQTTNRRQTGLQHSTDIRWDCTCTSKSWLQLKWAAYKWNKAQWGPYRSFLLSSAVWQTTYRTNAQIHGVTSICPVRGGRLSVGSGWYRCHHWWICCTERWWICCFLSMGVAPAEKHAYLFKTGQLIQFSMNWRTLFDFITSSLVCSYLLLGMWFSDWKLIRFAFWSGVLVLYGSEPPLTQRNNKRGARRGTGINVHHVRSAPTNPSN